MFVSNQILLFVLRPDLSPEETTGREIGTDYVTFTRYILTVLLAVEKSWQIDFRGDAAKFLGFRTSPCRSFIHYHEGSQKIFQQHFFISGINFGDRG